MDLLGQVPWGILPGRVGVVELDRGWGLRGHDLSVLVSDLRLRGIAFAFQGEPLTPTEGCGSGVEGFEGPAGPHAASPVSLTSSVAEESAKIGSPISLVLDAPFAFGHLYDGRSACRWSRRKVIQEVVSYVHAVSSAVVAHFGRVNQPFPRLRIGDAEPLWAGVSRKAMEDWIAAYRAAAGSQLSFFHLEVDFGRPDWQEAARQLEVFCRKRGIPFGIVFTGQGASDRAFASATENRFVEYETRAGGHPDQVVFTSRPGATGFVFDQGEAAMLAGLVGRYLRTRTTLALEVEPSVHPGSYRALVTLSSSAGVPVAKANVDLSLTPVGGLGSFDAYSLSGVVPAGATAARVGVDVDTRCACVGRADFALYGATYRDGGRTPNRVPNPDFSRGLHSWAFSGSGAERVEPTDRGGTGSMLGVRVEPNREAAVTSGPFAVRPGTRFDVEFDARVAPVSTGTGSFVVDFLRSGAELQRRTIPLAPISYDLGVATTDDAGSLHVTFHPPGVGQFVVGAWFAGDDRLWPAYREGPAYSPG